MTTHVFIVDATTFKYHLEYQFVGTGMKDIAVDFNNSPNTHLKPQTENTVLGMIADFFRVRVGDLVIFYLQQNFQQGIYEGKFYGVFKIKSLVFVDNNDEQQFLKYELQKSLPFRCLIEPFEVYAEGVTEWEALDDISRIQTPNQMLWSLIYRKLKGNRGNTMITMYESERLIGLIRYKNQYPWTTGQNFDFDLASQKIFPILFPCYYNGRIEKINILPRLIQKYNNRHQFETHLQAYILQIFEYFCQKTGLLNTFQGEYIEWIGNEIGCGVGMQKIDIMSFIYSNNSNCEKIVPIELKSTCVDPNILNQMQKYIRWIEQYIFCTQPIKMPVPMQKSYCIQPVIVCREPSSDKELALRYEFFQECKYNNMQISYIEFKIQGDQIIFERIYF